MTFRSRLFGRILSILIVALLAHPVLAQSLQEYSDKIRAAVDAGNESTAITDLRALKGTNAGAFERNNFDYLLARLLEKSGDQSSSSSGYQSVVARRSLLSQYALWHLAQIARSSGDLVLERERLRQVTITAPTSLLRDAATIRLAQSFSESTDYTAAVSALRPLIQSKNVRLARQALMLSGEAYLHGGKSTEGRDVFNRLVSSMPDGSRPDDFTLTAVRALDALDKQEAGRSPALSEAEHLQRANVYQFNRDFAGARVHYLAVVDNFAQSGSVPDALYQIGRGLYQEGNYDESLKYLRRLTSNYGSSPSARDALALEAGTLSRQKRTADAVAKYKEFIDLYPTAPNPERAFLNIIDALRDGGRDQEALSWVKQTRDRFKGQLGATLALFAQARIHIAQNSWTAVVSDLDELAQAADLGGARIAGGTNTAEVLFLRAFALEQLGRTQEAIDAYLSIPEGRNEYYGFRANERLQVLRGNPKSLPFITGKIEALGASARLGLESGGAEAARRNAQTAMRIEADAAKHNELLDMVRRAYAVLPVYKFPSFQLLPLGRKDPINTSTGEIAAPTHQLLADELLFLRLYDEGAPELAAARLENDTTKSEPEKNEAENKTDAAYTLAVYFLRGEMPYPAVRFAEQVWRAIPSDYVVELAPRQLTEMLYPAPYKAALLKHSPPRQLDARFVLSIARQETRFQADAKSIAAARGLMQFISATAMETAAQLGRTNFQQDELYSPDVAVEFGAQYLSTLFQRFPKQPQAVASAYNGGADNIARWIARSHSQDPDRYVPEIGFAQSKDYVFRVMSNYWVYQRLYNETLQSQP